MVFYTTLCMLGNFKFFCHLLFLSPLYLAECDIGVKISVCLDVRPSVCLSVCRSTCFPSAYSNRRPMFSRVAMFGHSLGLYDISVYEGKIMINDIFHLI